MAITTLTVKMMNKELEALMKDFAAKHKLSLGNQRISYARDGSTMKLSVEFGDKATTGDANPIYFKDCARKGFMYGLDTKDIGRAVRTSKGNCIFMGVRGKFAIVQAPDKTFWKNDPVMIATMLKADAALATLPKKV
jgi:hypothetical protein